jgi:hypothetical protein
VTAGGRPAARGLAAPAAVLAAALAACTQGPAPLPDAGSGQSAAPAPLLLPDASAVAASERARVGALRVLHARGVAEARWRDAEGEHFDQGDADLRWSAARGIAVGISKLGERYAWVGSDGRRWWRFEPKATPSRLVTGSGPDDPSSGVPSARVVGLLPLEPAAGAVAELRDGSAWFAIAPAGAARAEAAFDPATLEPRAVRLVARDGSAIEAVFDGFLAVETAGAAPGAWPRIPRRVRVAAAGTSIVVALDVARADAEAADRAQLYDLDALRTRFAPQAVEER